MEGEMKNLVEVCLATIASLCYTYFVSLQISKGKFRLFSLLPVLALFAVLPLHLTYAFPTAIATFFITWIANFKLVLFAFDLGPLSSQPRKSLLVFISFALLPIRNMDTSSNNAARAKKLDLDLSTEILLFSVLIVVLSKYEDFIHHNVALALYCCIVHLLVNILMSVSNVVAWAILGLELERPSNEPYLSTSLQDFWGKRWNLLVTSTLHQSVYKPLRPKWGPMPAIMAAFVVSGLMHELMFYYATRVCPTWEMTGFFVLHGVCVVAEIAVKRAVSGRWRLPAVVAAPLTVGFVVATSSWLFFPPLMSNGTIPRISEEFNSFVGFIEINAKSICYLIIGGRY